MTLKTVKLRVVNCLILSTKNYDESSKFCHNIFDECYSPIHKQIMDAHKNKKQINVSDDFDSIKTEYNRRAIGPAKDEVLKVGPAY